MCNIKEFIRENEMENSSETSKLVTKIKHFKGDEGDYTVYRGKERSFLFFTGAVVYQGYAERDGGLYAISETAWDKIWPADQLFWKDHAVDIRSIGLRIMKKRALSTDLLIPNITWDFDHLLYWNKDTDSFEKQGFET